ncbi:MAG: M48 family metalloprotease [Planctomycetes bacterium]|jgi:heat shock protein HtpX|nr:M48 family metallopeptidase [Phycisphaerae bacterium]NBB95123.1 M48 family metalloprotease [Planctomycetota bacterium]
MAVQTFHQLIARNKRNSVLLIAGFMVFFLGLGLLIGMVWSGVESGGVDPVTGEDRPVEINWHFSVGVAAVAAGIAFLLTMASYYKGGDALLSMSGARQISKADDPQLFNVVDELAIAAGQPAPRIYIINDTAMNAFATGRDPKHATVAITIGLRQKLNRDELQAVMAHEMSHVRHYDILYATLMAVLVGTLVMLCDIFLRSLWFGAGSRRRSRDRQGGNPLQLILLVIAVILAIIAPILARMIQMALSRQREYLADAGAVELTRNPDGLAAALNKLTSDQEVLEVANRATAPLYIVHPIKKFEERSSSIFKTHPPIKDRVRRIMSLVQ